MYKFISLLVTGNQTTHVKKETIKKNNKQGLGIKVINIPVTYG